MAARMATALLGVLVFAAAQSTADQKAVMDAVNHINEAYKQRDVKTYEALTTADFVRVTANGRAFDRSAWMGAVGAPGGPRPIPSFDQVSIRIFGNAALMTYRGIPAPGATDPPVPSFLTRVMVKEGNAWKQAFSQTTDTRTPAAPTGAEPPVPAGWSTAWSPSTPAERGALAAYQAIQKANRESDMAAWEKLSMPEHRIINVDGTVMSRAERVAQIKATPPDPNGFGDDRDLRVMVKGDLALIISRTDAGRSLKVLARRNGVWQQVLQQFSPVVAAR